MVEEQQKHDFGRRGTSRSLPQVEMRSGTDKTMIPSEGSGMSSDAPDEQKEVFFSPWAICH